MTIKVITVESYQQALKEQQLVFDRLNMALKCPMCGTVQTPRDLIAAGAGKTFDDVEPYFGFSCVGRWKDAPTPEEAKKNPQSGCNWTLGGLFRMHKLEVETPDGERHPRFEVATTEEIEAAQDKKYAPITIS